MRDTLEYTESINMDKNNVITAQKKENEKIKTPESIYETNDISIEMHHKLYIHKSLPTNDV